MSTKNNDPVRVVLALVCIVVTLLYLDAERRRRNTQNRLNDAQEIVNGAIDTWRVAQRFYHEDWRVVMPTLQQYAHETATLARDFNGE